MTVSSRPNRYHHTRDVALLKDPWTPAELRTLARSSPRPLSAKAVPGTETHRKLLAAGAVVYQQCPPLQVDAAAAAVRDWAEAHSTLPVEPMRGLDLVELWTTWYEVVHAGWSPTAPHEALAGLFADLVTDIDPDRSVVCRIDEGVVAAAFVFSADDPEEVLTEALRPDHPRARDAVASCMASALGAARGVVRFDGHASDPHFYPLWQTVPGVYAGESDPLDLLEIPNGAT